MTDEEIKKTWYQKRKERARERQKKYYYKNREKCIASSKRNYKKNAEKYREYQRQYFQENKEKIYAKRGLRDRDIRISLKHKQRHIDKALQRRNLFRESMKDYFTQSLLST